jgi:hypothetical protein
MAAEAREEVLMGQLIPEAVEEEKTASAVRV